MPAKRPKKVYRLNYYKRDANSDAALVILGDPGEIKMGVGPKHFIAVDQNAVTLAGGFPAKINIQGMSSSMKYAGMLSDLPFPATLIPSTVFTPFPKQIIKPPLMELLPTLREFAMIAASFVAV